MIGLTLKYPTLAGEGKGPEQALIDSWGGLDAALALLYRMNVRSIEISFIFSKMPDPVTQDILRRLYDAGMQVSIHGALEDMTGEAYLERFDFLFRTIFDHQDKLSITLHGLTDLPATKRITGDWAQALLGTWPGITLAVESQRVRDESFPGEKEHFRINNIPATLPKSPNVGICWDMGHYAYNVVKSGLPIETVPSPEALSLVRHTHIH
ncbi:MAG: hypothetical protein J5859_06155, partial [Clostridia bacterium]|nr:hypothetical protein [Clostridia bacterium]